MPHGEEADSAKHQCKPCYVRAVEGVLRDPGYLHESVRGDTRWRLPGAHGHGDTPAVPSQDQREERGTHSAGSRYQIDGRPDLHVLATSPSPLRGARPTPALAAGRTHPPEDHQGVLPERLGSAPLGDRCGRKETWGSFEPHVHRSGSSPDTMPGNPPRRWLLAIDSCYFAPPLARASTRPMRTAESRFSSLSGSGSRGPSFPLGTPMGGPVPEASPQLRDWFIARYPWRREAAYRLYGASRGHASPKRFRIATIHEEPHYRLTGP